MAQEPKKEEGDKEVLDLLKAKEGFLNKKGETISFSDATKNVEIIGIYFSAHWCGPCQRFTPILSKYYNEAWKNEKMEIIFGSSDKDEKAFKEYFESMGDWLAFPYKDGRIEKLKKKYGVSGIPWLVVIDKNGKLIENEADTSVGSYKEKAIEQWK